jgi:DNA-binding transcriptional LysR family regulator
MKINNIDLNKIKCFQAVAETGSLADGAKFLNLTTSAVYQSIKKLEEDLMVKLFYRTGKKYVLTSEGVRLSEIYQGFHWSLDQFLESSNATTKHLSGELKVGLPLNFSKQIFIPIMKKFCDMHPAVQFSLTISETQKLLRSIENFDLHFAITDDFINKELVGKLEKEPIFKEELVMISSKEFAKENLENIIRVKELKEFTHLCYAKNLPLLQKWYQLVYHKQVSINHFHVVDNVETMLVAVENNLGIGIVPKDLVVHSKKYHIIEIKNQRLYNQLFLVQESNFIPNVLCKKFLDFLKLQIKLL